MMRTLADSALPYRTGRSREATGATARLIVSCPSNCSACSSVMRGRFCMRNQSSRDPVNHSKRSTYRMSAPMAEMLSRKARSRPWMAVPIRVTVTTPITMPSVVSAERILFARMASQEMLSPSLTSASRFMEQKPAARSPAERPRGARRSRSNRRECEGFAGRASRCPPRA